MVAFSARRRGPELSKYYLPKAIETELRTRVLDAVEESHPVGDNGAPQIIIGNLNSGCHGTYFHRADGTEFIFHHCKMKYASQCKCIVKAAAGDTTYQIPEDLDEYRIRLIFGKNVPYRLEPKLAGMVAMKIFLGMSVPQPLRMNALPDIDEEAMDEEPTSKPDNEEENQEK